MQMFMGAPDLSEGKKKRSLGIDRLSPNGSNW